VVFILKILKIRGVVINNEWLIISRGTGDKSDLRVGVLKAGNIPYFCNRFVSYNGNEK